MKASDHRYDLGVKGQCQIYLKSVLNVYNANSSFISRSREFILNTLITYGVEMTTKVSDRCYDLGSKSQCQIYFIFSYGS